MRWTFIVGERADQANPILPDTNDGAGFGFVDAPSGAWFDPLPADSFDFRMNGDERFTHIVSLPEGFISPFDVSVGGNSIGTFGPGQVVDFVALTGDSVSSFRVSGINPEVDAENPAAFPVQLAFDTPSADFTMSAVALTPGASRKVPVPAWALAAMLGLVAVRGVRRSRV